MISSKTVLEVKNLSKAFLGVKALDKVYLEVNKGEVHAVIGENGAGKSTMMNIILGDLRRDEGEIIFKGKTTNFSSPAEAIREGISMIHQEISLVPTLSVSENIWLNREGQFSKRGFIDAAQRDEATRVLLQDKLKLDVNGKNIVSTLTVAQMQLVEIARAVSCNSDVIIMDEPTSALSVKEIKVIFNIIRHLAEQGVAIIFISHKLEELFEICDRVSVYRDGHYIGTRLCAETTRDELIKMIIGRDMTEQYPVINCNKGEVVLKVEHLCSRNVFDDISFEVHKGEILGFSGLVGAGRSEIMRAIFGIDKFTKGYIEIEGKEVKICSPHDAVEHGIGMVTEDRLRIGIIPEASVSDNISIATLSRFCNKLGVVNKKQEKESCKKYIKDLSVKVTNIDMPISSLSGGNQQKAIVARWLMTYPKVFILDEPTRGIDVGAKSEIYNIIGKLAEQGIAIIMVSSEMPEILGICDRIIVIRDGKITGECTKEEATQEILAKYALG